MHMRLHMPAVRVAALLALALLLSCALPVAFAGAAESGPSAESAGSSASASASSAGSEGPDAVAGVTGSTTGLVSVDGKTYLFDEAGVQQVGWHKVGDVYRCFRHGEGKAGYMVTGKVVNGIQLTDSGIAVATDEAREELEILVKAQELCDEVCEPGDSVEQKLEKIYQWMLDDCEERGAEPFEERAGWQRGYALDILDTHSGSCDSFGAGFAYLACAAGAEECAVVSSGGHTWAEVNGAVYDPEMGKQTDSFRYFAFPYDKSGEDEDTPDYAANRIHVVQIAPRTETWGKVSAADIAAAESRTGETGWTERAGKRLYARDGVVLAAQWLDLDGARYYLCDDGQPACGPALVDGEGFVFGDDGRLLEGDATRIEEVGGAQYRVDAEGRAVNGWYVADDPAGEVGDEPDVFAGDQASEGDDSQRGGAADGRSPLGRLFGLLVGVSHEQDGNVSPMLRYSLETGQVATGVCYSHDSIAVFTPEGAFDAARTHALRASAEGGDTPALLAELGEPERVDRSPSCRPGFEGGFENTYIYPNVIVHTYNAPDDSDVLNYIEARTRSVEEPAGAQEGPVSGGAADTSASSPSAVSAPPLSVLDESTQDAVAAFAKEHGGDLRSCFEALSYREGERGFMSYGDTGRPTVEGGFTDERIAQEARAAFVEHTTGNCYTFTVAFWCVAEQLGYEARPVVGTMVHEKSGKEYPTSWVEIRDGDTWNIYDPLHPDNLYAVPYGTYESVKRA